MIMVPASSMVVQFILLTDKTVGNPRNSWRVETGRKIEYAAVLGEDVSLQRNSAVVVIQHITYRKRTDSSPAGSGHTIGPVIVRIALFVHFVFHSRVRWYHVIQTDDSCSFYFAF